MSQILKKMEANKIVKKMPAKDDKRKTYILLTASGKKMVEQTRYERDAWLSNAISQTLTQKEKKLLGEALPVLHKLAKAEEATRDNRN
jgi:DNA-binding MarR family transcriptional regulator